MLRAVGKPRFRLKEIGFSFPLLLLAVIVLAFLLKHLTVKKSARFVSDDDIDAVVDLVSRRRPKKLSEWLELCADWPRLCAPKFLDLNEPFVRKIVVAPEYKLLSCILPKCMSSVTTQVYSYLYDNTTYSDFNWHNNYGLSATHHRNDFDNFKTFQHNLGVSDADLNEWSLNAVVRDPLDRFVSAFVNKCLQERLLIPREGPLYGDAELCYGCGEDLDCFTREQFRRVIMYSRGGLTILSYEDQHTFPQNWFCDFKTHQRRYSILKHESDYDGHVAFRQNMANILRRQNVSNQAVDYVFGKILPPLPARPTHPIPDQLDPDQVNEPYGSHRYLKQRAAVAKRTILSSRKLFSLFMSMFLADYAVFGYELPTTRF